MEDNNQKTQFHAVLADPASVSADALEALVARYPYAQSLRVAQARRGLSGEPEAASLPLLYVGAPHRLQGLLADATPAGTAEDEDILLVDDIESLDGEQDEPLGERPADAVDDASALPLADARPQAPVFHIDDPEAAAADQILEAEEDAAEPVITETETISHAENPEPIAIETVVPDSHNGEQLAVDEALADSDAEAIADGDSLDALPEHPVATDFLAYEQLETQEEDAPQEAESHPEPAEEAPMAEATPLAEAPVDEGQQIVPASQARPHEKVSVYDDEHLPYTFLWWLNKARMDHADTYQPYASRTRKPEADSPHVAGEPEDQVLLDQQIRENIFHLQPPEEKLATGNDGHTVPFKVPKKTDPIIERFIREEPQIKPPNPDKLTQKNMAKHSAEDAQDIVTETLANIYADQGHYNKAIDAYKKLSLKYPEKSSYFADRISELEKKFM